MSPVYVRRFLLFSHLIVLLLSAGNGNGDHDHCPDSFDCGSLGTIRFPFTKSERHDCGVLAIRGCDDHNQTKHVQLINGGKWFQVTEVNNDWWSRSISIIDQDFSKALQKNACEAFSYNIHLPPPSPLGYFYMKDNITTFKCNHTTIKVSTPINFFKNNTCSPYDFYFGHPNSEDESRRSLASCSVLHLPVIKGFELSGNPFTFLTYEFTIYFQSSADCGGCFMDRDRRGSCRLDSNGKSYCAIRKDRISTWKLAMALVALVGVVVAVLIVLACCFRTKIAVLLFWKENPTHRIIEEFLKKHGPIPAARYSYSDVKKITKSFRYKLGEGGYGCVYKGKLHEGRVVAVKILSKSKGDGEEFINEVASIGRTSHVNIVRLLGFCLDGSERVLIYEFMPNGSLEKFIYEERNPSQVSCQLDCKTLYDIAIGVARGLEYLHRGCNTRILHFDIKPHNILLDENFCPKISDFGLAKICTRKESTVSIFGARGTAGYIAPEELGLQNIKNESDDEIMRKMTIVGLWCIQTNPLTRPAISKVVEMLEGRVELLPLPPKPFLSSPSTSPVHLSLETLTVVCENTKM